jgi:hypothetical protein
VAEWRELRLVNSLLIATAGLFGEESPPVADGLRPQRIFKLLAGAFHDFRWPTAPPAC